MDPELKALIEEINKRIVEFQAANDLALAEKADKGQVDILAQENVDKLNAAIDAATDKMQERIDEIERKANYATLNRPGADPNTEAFEAAEFARLVTGDPAAQMDVEAYRAYQGAFNVYARRGPATPSDMKAALEVGGDPTGGYYVTPDLTGRIARLVRESSPIRQDASVVTITTDALDGFNDLAQAGFGWVGETEARPETTTPVVGKWSIPVHEMYAEPRATQKMLDDAGINIEAWLQGKVGSRFARAESAAFVNGTGILQPRGILTYDPGVPSETTWNVIERVNSGNATAFPAAGSDPAGALFDIVEKLKAAYRANAVWHMARSTWSTIRQMKDSQGNYLFGAHQLSDGVLEFRLLGFPVRESEDFPAISANALAAAFGDFREAYQIVDRTGIRVLRDPFTTKGFIKFYSTRRVGGDVVNFEAIKILKIAA